MKQRKMDPMMSQHKAPRKRVCEEEEERMVNAVAVVAWDDAEDEEGEVPTVTPSLVVKPFSAVDVDVLICGQSGSQMIGEFSCGATRLGI
ncbi:unnamed protein product [Alternaria alternata]